MPKFGFDNWIDAQLRNVPVPPDLLSRLAEGAASGAFAADDARLDAALRDVPVPPYLEARLLRIARRQGAPLVLRWAMAASIFMLLGFGAAAYVGLITGGWGKGSEMLAQGTQGAAPAAGVREAGVLPLPNPRPAQAAPALAAQQKPAATSGAAAPAEVDRPVEQAIAASEREADAPSAESVAKVALSITQSIDAQRLTQSALGAGGDFARLPSLDALEPGRRGIIPPAVPGYDMLFQLKHGEHPFVSPAAHKNLLSIHVPLTLRTASYDLALRALAHGQSPSSDEIRVEDFVAAQNNALPPARAGDVALYAAASPSPFGKSGLYLLEVAAQAGPQRQAAHPTTRLVVVLDTSAAMSAGARWEASRRALAKLAADMAPQDRLTLIGFAEQSHVLAESATRQELQALLAGDAMPKPAGSADLMAAVRSAAAAVQSVASKEPQRVVFITSGREDIQDLGERRAGGVLAQLSAAEIPWQIVRLASGEVDPQWSELAEQGHGEVTQAATAADIHLALARKLTGRFATVAGAAKLKLRFNPEVVTSYRLLGHESATLTGPTDRLEIDLGANDAAAGVFELWVKPQGEQLAIAELSWRDPTNGQPHGKVQPVFRSKLAESFSAAPNWFQQGVLAAKTAEALRGSFYATGPRPFSQILDLAGQVDPAAAASPDFQGLLHLIKQADKRR